MTEAITESRSATVLVVEDETDLADLYTAWLADMYEVQTAYAGGDALEKLDKSMDVVLLDRRMPSISGDEVLDEIRNQDLNCRVVIVSAVTPDFDVIGMGFDDYLTKPVDADELHGTVERMLARTEYDETMQEYQQLVATRGALETEKSEQELRASDGYANLRDRIADLETVVDASVEEFSDEDFEAAFRDLNQETSNKLSESETPDDKLSEGWD